MSNNLRPHGLQHVRLPCSSLSLLKLTSDESDDESISSSIASFSSCPQSFPASWSFPTSRLFATGGQSIGASTSAPVLAKNIQCWSPFRIDWFYPFIAQGTLKSLLQHHSPKASILQDSAFFTVQLSHPYMESTASCYLKQSSKLIGIYR